MKRKKLKDDKYSKIADEKSKFKYKCSCGHVITICPFEHKEKKVCSWCGYYVYTSKEAEFKDRLNQRLKGA